MVTFAVSSVELSAYNGEVSHNVPITSCKEFKKEGCKDIVQATPMKAAVAASTSGFVRGAIQAYNRHHNLVLRPDDIWLAIMVQFGLYVNGNAEELRSSLVKHDGQKELTVTTAGSLYSVDFGQLSKQMIDQMDEHLVDPALKEWVLPAFSTTTDHDTIVASVVLMASMKKYFSYKFGLCCGIPQVTLEGTAADWEGIRARVDKLKTFGGPLSEWSVMLAPILDQFVVAAKGNADADFWNRICHRIGGGSGPSYISGWLSVFCAFNEDGKWQGDKKTVHLYYGEDVESEFPIVDTSDIPPGYLTVDVKIDDNGTPYDALMFAGHMAFAVSDDKTTLTPALSWAIALKNGEPEPEQQRM
ncbi:hypothetical protein SPRG_07669 [Saprolegnia parasitica CBS 223.65]|uniref:DUF4419 domain-containing protein n=1 Tax=Saprolegnia parasitica (strain CBS 223.65) TaxID=695850 RepID=A0A067CK79_SAPPC|nr:hypothetical protein SPRG_07669 [Saprolegnia parasitica CBS 223.65]KDO26956.1 hypothetical protein SPRG_07669 [Saprolegnia parasitica CBS 223.65]|eukprot:XP_012202337.1 hypothetical protein SPRG_07669 [Saprolegnia parasitica CBS 223.65]